jgi:hypothetical protein
MHTENIIILSYYIFVYLILHLYMAFKIDPNVYLFKLMNHCTFTYNDVNK